ncbi:MAG: SDR family oxidoreductase [Chloroflexi bacterium]|nr:SDR family oxidoreductase [Chloroflexota bacterium]MCI0575780.1 SDR family oxidoreductase [Chloroflexota bacterium]MCI0643613.1 SDR family oxidoreductase [Chloroflexota bacterium]MCI0726831.1 SDR family oxidoreductase [Chloroflexota bacterium]
MANSGKVLVTGATGNTGSGLVPALRAAGVDVRALVRDEAKAQPLRDVGAELVVGDLDQPETIGPAVEGVDKIYLLTWNGPTQARQAENVINAAKQAGTPHLVRHSMWGSEKSRIVQQGNQVEEAVKSSGLPWTLLKPTFFMQNTMMAAPTIASDGMIYWDMQDGKLAMIDVRDVVDVALAVLTGSGHESKSYILTGPEAISFHDVAATFSKVLGKNVRYVSVPGEASLQSMVGMGFPEWIARGYVELSEGFSENFANSVTDNVASLTGRPARSFEQFANDFAQVFGGDS